MAATYETQRQQEIAEIAAKGFGVKATDITGITTQFGIPTAITYTNDEGTGITRDIRASYGELLTDGEFQQLIKDRASAAGTGLENLNGYVDQLGQDKRPVPIDGGGKIKQDTSNSTSFNPSNNRLISAGLKQGATTRSSNSNSGPIIKFKASNGNDHRVRITVPSALASVLLDPAPLNPLKDTQGVLFPYTPQITVNHTANYNAENLTHSNYAYQFYQSSGVEEISITGTFAAKNSSDASYVIAAQHFFRTATKMFYGQDAWAGVPPPVLRLDGHGDLQFSSVPVVITGFSSSYPDDVDYITADTSGASSGMSFNGMSSSQSNSFDTRVPVIQTFTVTCRPVYSRKSISQEFSVTGFAAGKLLGKPARGGFI